MQSCKQRGGILKRRRRISISSKSARGNNSTSTGQISSGDAEIARQPHGETQGKEPARGFRGDPSIEFQTLSNEDDDITQNMCSKFKNVVSKLNNFESVVQFAACSGTIVCGPSFTSVMMVKCPKMFVNHQIHKTETTVEIVQTRLQDLTNFEAEFDGISLRQNCHTKPWNVFLSPLESLVGNLLRFRICIVWERTTSLQTRHVRQSYLKWDPMTFMDKYENTGRPVQFHSHIFSGHKTIQTMTETPNVLGVHGTV